MFTLLQWKVESWYIQYVNQLTWEFKDLVVLFPYWMNVNTIKGRTTTIKSVLSAKISIEYYNT